ncbi:hypothetical protein BGZ70_009727 [Mortierella alpina]|uniref:Uncharacterized protein n=1 Tax=Mortierella alpina TaxID=64518 RepID=A0A9P6J0S1_MORAP|nr:hypothetical protein BGZ70_009727 [Mortierella alpina]
MVALSKSLLLLLGTAIACAAAQKTSPAAPAPTPAPAPEHTALEMSQVIDCQTQCIAFKPPFSHPPDINAKMYMKVKDHGRMSYLYKNMRTHVKPCVKNLLKLKGKRSSVTKALFEEYVLCNSKTLGKNEDVYFNKNFNWKKEGFNKAQWTEFRNRTLPGFRRALHKCRGGCRRIHFAHKGAPKP